MHTAQQLKEEKKKRKGKKLQLKLKKKKEKHKKSHSHTQREKAECTVSRGNPSIYTIPLQASIFTVVFNKHLHKSLEGKKKSVFFHTIPQN